jgi:hypothetical protein
MLRRSCRLIVLAILPFAVWLVLRSSSLHASAAPSLLAGTLLAGSTPVTQPTDLVPLFNGRDLTGWVNINCAPDTFTVRNGEIHSTGKPICALRTEKMYENFVLELEYLHETPGGNAGLFIWADALPARGQPFLRAIEVQILDGRETANYTSHGDVFSIHGARFTPDRPHPNGWERSLPIEKRAKPAGQWNHYRVTAKDGRITLAVNGKDVSGGTGSSPRKGYLALESEEAPARFRNIRLRELPSATALAPEHIARADEGFVSLYNGKDLRGWRVPGTGRARWVAKDWTLLHTGSRESVPGGLVSERTFGDVDLMVDWRVREPGPDESVRESPPPAQARVIVQPSVAPPGHWHRTLFSFRGNRRTVIVDGTTIVDEPVPAVPARGPIVLLPGDRQVEFANIFVRAPSE